LSILEVENIETFYGKSHILNSISLSIEKGQIVALLGRNGAGKTTTLRSIMGLTPPKKGIIKFKEKTITGKKPFEIARLGIGFVPEDRGIFPNITVLDNLEIGVKDSADNTRTWTIDKVFYYFPVLEKLKENKGKNLSGGEQQMLTIARTLMGNPELVLLDEPSEGLAPQIVNVVLFRLIKELRAKEGATIFLAEQNMNFTLGLIDWGYILDKGAIHYNGSSQDIQSDERIQREYLAV
jgi:branched-chain amino acid transport system ATP-binding protein